MSIDQVPAIVKVLVVDDHSLFRRGLIAILADCSQLRVVADVGDAGAAQRSAQLLQPDLILLDNHLPGVNGVDALPALRAAAPSAKIVLLTVSEDEGDLAAALTAGANGYLLKTIDADALIASLLRVLRGDSVVADEMTSKLVAAYRGAATSTASRNGRGNSGGNRGGNRSSNDLPVSPLEQLSPREREILRGVARGSSNKRIAIDLGIAETTVKIHVQHLLRKLDVSSRVQAAVIATEQRLI